MPLLALVFQAALALLICILAPTIAQSVGLIDTPDSDRKLHVRPTPLVGGLAVMIPVLVAAAAFVEDFTQPIYLVTCSLALFFFVIGLLDDHKHVPASWRLALAFLVTSVVFAVLPDTQSAALYFGTADNFIQLGSFAAIFFALCLVCLVNSVNMADGHNGLVIGMSVIWALALFLQGPEWVQPICLGLLACLAITLVFNLMGKLFLGDSGSYGIAAIIGLLVIQAHIAEPQSFPAERVIMWFLMPVADCCRIILLRLGMKQSPFTPDRSHLHHILSAWLGPNKGLAAYWVLVAVPVAVSIEASMAALLPLMVLTLVIYISTVQLATAEAIATAPASSFK